MIWVLTIIAVVWIILLMYQFGYQKGWSDATRVDSRLIQITKEHIEEVMPKLTKAQEINKAVWESYGPHGR